MEERINIPSLKEQVSLLCSEYHIHGDVVERKSSDPTVETEYYIVAGLYSVPKDDPKAIVNQADRSFLLFHPYSFALKVDEDTNPLKLIEETVEYCKEAEFIKAIYNEFRCTVPEVIRCDELYTLKRYNDQRHNKKLNSNARQQFHRGLQKFFKNESTKSKYKLAWKKHYRSERFNEEVPLIKQHFDFWRRKNPEVSLKTLHRSCDNLKITVLHEKEYKYFKKQMKKKHREISYSVGEKYVIDHGIIKTPEGVENPFGECVTYDEFFKKLTTDFVDYGYDALANLNVSRWEFRNITYRAADESIIASVINPYRLGFLKDNMLSTVMAFGDIDVISIPNEEILNFYSLAKACNMPFYIDELGEFADPSLEYVHIVYSQASQKVMNRILNQLVGDKISGSHMITEKQRNKHLLAHQIDEAELQDKQFKSEKTSNKQAHQKLIQER